MLLLFVTKGAGETVPRAWAARPRAEARSAEPGGTVPRAARRGRPRPARSGARARARALYRQGVQAYNLAEFQRARALFRRAYEVLPLPGFLFNIGQCERMLGRCERAVFLYRRYLAARPNAPNRAVVQGLITECLGDRQHRAHGTLPEGSRPRRQSPFLPPRPPPSRPPLRRSLARSWWFWTAIGAGAAVLTGLAWGLTARRSRATGPEPGSLQTLDLRGLP